MILVVPFAAAACTLSSSHVLVFCNPALLARRAGGRGAGPALDQLDQPVAVALHPVTGDVYISDRANHRVVLWAADATQGVVVAGGNGWGDGLHQLACPAACHVTADSSVYVCDEANNRVVKWKVGDTEGTVVAGGQGAGVYH